MKRILGWIMVSIFSITIIGSLIIKLGWCEAAFAILLALAGTALVVFGIKFIVEE
jgi:hypothetical protein